MRRLRHLEIGERGRALVEVTCKTVHSRFLLRPSAEANAIIVGVLGRAQQRYGVDICAMAFLSNHFHLIVEVTSCRQLARFMRYVNSNLARKIGRLYQWRDRFFARRYAAIQISDEEPAQIERLLYILQQGCKEGLVRSPLDWPGVHCAWSLCRGKWEMEGWWEDQTALYRARLRGEKVKRGQFRQRQTLVLSPLPCWADRPRQEVRDEVRGLVAEIESQMRASRRPVLGADRILRQHPHAAPEATKRRPPPAVHAASREVRQLLREAYHRFVSEYREAARRLRAGDLTVEFPLDCFPPRFPLPDRPAPPV